jgi:5-hydroxyisourate hydrolase-like protein (transthyretin family)
MLKLTGVGSTSEALFPVGTNLYAPVWVKNSGTPDTISVSVVADTTSAPFGGRVKVKWNITENTAGGGDYRLTFGWVSQLENTAFRTPNREHNAHIFWLEDTTEAGSGLYTLQYSTQPYTSSRGNITHLGSYAVGRFKDVPDITGVKRTDDNIPKEFYLSQNYPNPFNPSTNISYTLKNSGKARLSVYDLLGREVAVLANEIQAAGQHEVKFLANGLSSGIYFYKLQAVNGVITKKMMLLK